MRLSVRRTCLSLAATFLAVGLSAPANAAFIQYGSRTTFDALGPYVGVDWSAFGADGAVISTPDSRTVGGVTVGVSSSQGIVERYNEGSSFTGNFAVGDRLIGDAGSQSDSFIIRFGSPVQGFGTQIDSHYASGAYSGNVEVFSTSNALLFTAPFSGTNTFAEDNSAPFVGITSDIANISYAVFLLNQSDPLPPIAGSVLVNRLDVLATRVPEASSLAVLGAGLLGFFGIALFRRRAMA